MSAPDDSAAAAEFPLPLTYTWGTIRVGSEEIPLTAEVPPRRSCGRHADCAAAEVDLLKRDPTRRTFANFHTEHGERLLIGPEDLDDGD